MNNNQINELINIILEHSERIESIWDSDKNYIDCSVEIIHEYASCLGKLSGKLTAMKIEAKRGFLND